MERAHTRKVDAWTQTWSWTAIDTSKVARICWELGAAAHAFRERPVEQAHPHVWPEASFLEMRQRHRIVIRAA